MSLGDGVVGNGVAHYNMANGVGTVAGEHPYGEHPSRTLLVLILPKTKLRRNLSYLFNDLYFVRCGLSNGSMWFGSEKVIFVAGQNGLGRFNWKHFLFICFKT